MLLRRSARSGAVPVWKLRKWLPGVLAAALGLGGAAGWAAAQTRPAKPMPVTRHAGHGRARARENSRSAARAPEKTVSVNFKSANWDDVLDWFSKESGLTPILTVKPTG